MPKLDPAHIFFIASIIEIVTQLLKGPVPDKYRDLIPFILTMVGIVIGLAFGLYYQLDLVVAALEGFFGAALALGFYQLSSRVPGVRAVFGSRGWVKDRRNK